MLRLILKLHVYIFAATALITGSVLFFFHVVNKDYPGRILDRIAGFSPVEWFFFGSMGLLVVSMILHRIFIGPPVFTEEEEKKLKEEEEWLRKKMEEEFEDWFYYCNPSNPVSPLYDVYHKEDK